MYYNISSLFTNERMVTAINELHALITDKHEDLTLFQTLIVSHRWSREKIERLLQYAIDPVTYTRRNGNEKVIDFDLLEKFFLQWSSKTGKTQAQTIDKVSKFKLYNAREKKPAWEKATIVQYIMEDLAKHSPERAVEFQQALTTTEVVPIDTLNRMSLIEPDNSSFALAIKLYLVSHYSDDDIWDYNGIQALTGPVHQAISKQFGVNMGQYEQTMFCNSIAKDINRSPTYVNTALWAMGSN